MNIVNISHQAAMELANTLNKINPNEINTLINEINTCHTIFVTGAGRSLLMMKAFAMRLMHADYPVHIVGEVTTPAFCKGDLLIVASGSGETENLISIAKRAKEYRGKVISMTIFDNSSLAKISDYIVKIPAYSDKLPESENNKKGILAGGSIFEEALLLLSDSMIVNIIAMKKITINSGFKKHANLE